MHVNLQHFLVILLIRLLKEPHEKLHTKLTLMETIDSEICRKKKEER